LFKVSNRKAIVVKIFAGKKFSARILASDVSGYGSPTQAVGIGKKVKIVR
jgi:hypothetical protein